VKTALTVFALLIAFLVMADEPKRTATTDPKTAPWKCGLCNKWHTDLPFAYGPLYPDTYLAIPEAEREKRVQMDKDVCIIDGKYFFVRGRLEIPVRESKQTFAWDVWVSLSKANFDRTIELLETSGRESEPPYFGWLCTSLSLYPETTHLKVHVHTRPVGTVPVIELEATDHPLSVEQRKGITLERVKEIASIILHPAAKTQH
jgi:hypothetical protein